MLFHGESRRTLRGALAAPCRCYHALESHPGKGPFEAGRAQIVAVMKGSRASLRRSVTELK